MTEDRSLSRSLRRRAGRAWYRVHWLGWQRRQARHARIRRVAGLELVVLPGVLDPAVFFTSEVLADALRALVLPGERVLDLGSGCGIGTVAATRAGAGVVVAADLDGVALRCTRMNALLHGIEERVRVVASDCFDGLGEGERFDIVALNPPYLASAPGAGELERALRHDPAFARRFAGGLALRLSDGGRALLVLSSNGEPERWLGPLREIGWSLEPMLERRRAGEAISAWLVTRQEG